MTGGKLTVLEAMRVIRNSILLEGEIFSCQGLVLLDIVFYQQQAHQKAHWLYQSAILAIYLKIIKSFK